MNNKSIEFISVSKDFSQNKILHDINFSTEKGKIYGLIGKNGAGKTTIFKIIRGIIDDYSGDILVNGKNIRENNDFLENSFFLETSPLLFGFVNNFFKLFDFQSNYINSEIAEKEDFFKENIRDKKDNNSLFLSTGWKKVIYIEKLLRMKKIDFLFLDEPFEGLDIDFRFFLIEKIEQVVKSGATVLISSHNFFDIQNLTKNIILVDKGIVKFEGETDDIRKLWNEKVKR
ncbi:MAG: Glutamine transport ATP-binding protein GlnQ [Mycoplasmataceae bacterium]|nr:MAG: Glutamine transport ATP-binding protein GlnQ [Mycoplasmataceae bacterium]